MAIRKHIALTASATAMAVASVMGVSAVSAAATRSNSARSTLASELASKFNLSQSDVQSVIDQHKRQQAGAAEQRYQQRLNRAVTKGKLTAAQEQAILAEHTKLAAELTAARTKTGAERRAALKQVHDEASAWAKQQNLPLHWLLIGHAHLSTGAGGANA